MYSDNMMKCPAPVFSIKTNRRKRETPTTVVTMDSAIHIGFIMDALQSVQNMSENFPSLTSMVEVVKDPYYNKFSEGVEIYKGGGFLVLEVSSKMPTETNNLIVHVFFSDMTCSPFQNLFSHSCFIVNVCFCLDFPIYIAHGPSLG